MESKMSEFFETVTWFKPEREFGFVRGDDGQDLYLNVSQMVEGVEPRRGMRVVYFATLDEKRGNHWARAVRQVTP
jgi:cold shock CspA family protein